MNGIDLVMLFAIILMARLGMRLIRLYQEYQQDKKELKSKKNGSS